MDKHTDSTHIAHIPSSAPQYGIFNDSFPPIIDGVTLTVENYIRWLNAKGHPASVVTPWNPLRSDFECESKRYFSLPIPSRAPYRYGYPKLDPFIWRTMRNTNFRLVHAHAPFSSGRLALYAARKHDIPLIGTFHSKYRSDLEHSFPHAPWVVDGEVKRIIDFFNSCDHVWIPQAAVEETVREYGFKGELTVVENGNDFADIIRGDVAGYKAAARKRLGIGDDELSLLFVGQHIREKGVMEILEALRLIHGKVPFRMNFIGTGYAEHEMRRFTEDNGLSDSVTFNGVISGRDELSTHYAAADLFLFPSPYDNAPLVVREAAAMGTPALLLKGSTAAELVKDSDNGFLTSKEPTDFAARLTELSGKRDLIAEAGIRARKTLVRSWEDVVDEVIRRYADIEKTFKSRKS